LSEVILQKFHFPKSILLIGGCGYIGTFLYEQMSRLDLHPTVCDLLVRGNPLGVPVVEADYASLSAETLSGFDAVVWFAGHSSVQQALKDPQGALANNCLNLFGLAQKLKPGTKFIYASSGSLYSAPVGKSLSPAGEADLAQIPYQNAYDISKFAFDYLAENFLSNFYALRMGTLSGFSPNLRKELLFNAMNISAVTSGQVFVKNRNAYRTILFLDDLWMLVKALLGSDVPPGVYNAGSISGAIGEFAEQIASVWDAEVIDQGTSDTYSFLLDTSLMDKTIGAQTARPPMAETCRTFINQCRNFAAI